LIDIRLIAEAIQANRIRITDHADEEAPPPIAYQFCKCLMTLPLA
jgi:hypothetical protein